MNIDIKVGDIILGGRFKNKRIVVKNLGTNEIGQPSVNGRSLLNYRIEKMLPEDMRSRKTNEGKGMNKEAFDQIYEMAFINELEKMSNYKKDVMSSIERAIGRSGLNENTELNGLDDIDKTEIIMNLEDRGLIHKNIAESPRTIGDIIRNVKKQRSDFRKYLKEEAPIQKEIESINTKYPKEYNRPGTYASRGIRAGMSVGIPLGAALPVAKMVLNKKVNFSGLAKSIFGATAGGVSGAFLGGISGGIIGSKINEKTPYENERRRIESKREDLRKKYGIENRIQY